MLKVQLRLGKHLDIGAGRGAVLLKALLGKFTCGIPARMQKLETWRSKTLPEKCERVQEVAGAKPSRFFLLHTLCPSPTSEEEQIVLQSCFSMSKEEIWHQPLWL